MGSRPDTDDYLSIFLNDRPLLDVRAPVEFARGSFPTAVNMPLMNDEERHEVGICYKEKGQDAAIELGHKRVSGDVKKARIAAWRQFAMDYPEGYLFCFRGGLRSRLTQQWIRESGVQYPLVEGGYKALRRFLIDRLEAQVAKADFRIISGRTGTGKTRVLNQLPNPIDLEGIANHRGSSFGREVTPQPTQIDFENRLAIAMLKAEHQVGGPIYLEDESRLIGRCTLPHSLRQRMAEAPLMVLEQLMEERTRIIREDYVVKMAADFTRRDGEEAGWQNFEHYLLSALDRIQKRLGGERHRALRQSMERALANQRTSGEVSGHNDWIESLLKHYYDPMYDYQLEQKTGRILVRGGPEELLDFCKR